MIPLPACGLSPRASAHWRRCAYTSPFRPVVATADAAGSPLDREGRGQR